MPVQLCEAKEEDEKIQNKDDKDDKDESKNEGGTELERLSAGKRRFEPLKSVGWVDAVFLFYFSWQVTQATMCISLDR